MNLDINENDCRVLDAYPRPDLDIGLINCKFTNAGTRALAELLGRNQGPTKLEMCHFQNFVLADGLRGNSRLKFLRLLTFCGSRDGGRQEILAIVAALRENKGLVEFELRSSSGHGVSGETWGAVWDSLKTHPTLEVSDLNSELTDGTTMATARDRALLKSRIQALSDRMKVNMSIYTIRLHARDRQHELFRRSVIPYLETNRFRPRVRAIQKTRPITDRGKVLGRALLSARTDANSFWMLLSGNPEIAFPSTTATTVLVTNL
jgi:hypothetical protein